MEVDLTDAFIGGTYKHRSYDNNQKICQNWWPQIQKDPDGKSQYIAEVFPGAASFGTTPGTSSRGMTQHKEEIYIVVDASLYRVSNSGTYTSLGTILGGERCSFASVGESLLIAVNGRAYEWNGTTLTQGSDSDLGSPSAVAGLNNQAIYDFGSGQTFSVSNAGDYLNINALNYGSAEISGDDLVAPYVFEQTLRLFGRRTTETWWNTGVGSPPFERIQGGAIPVGIRSRHAICNTDTNIYFLGHDNNVYIIEQNRNIPVSPPPMVREIDGYTTVDDAVMFAMKYRGENIIVLNFPSEGKTWALQEGGEWFNLSTANSSWIGDDYAYCYGKHLLSDTSGNILEMTDSSYTHNGTLIKRILQSAPIHSGLFGRPGKMIELSSITVELSTGQGLVSGQGQKPRLMMSISEDGGRSFGTQFWSDIGVTGRYREVVHFYGLGGTSDSRVIRFELSDPVYCSIHKVLANVDVGI